MKTLKKLMLTINLINYLPEEEGFGAFLAPKPQKKSI